MQRLLSGASNGLSVREPGMHTGRVESVFEMAAEAAALMMSMMVMCVAKARQRPHHTAWLGIFNHISLEVLILCQMPFLEHCKNRNRLTTSSCISAF